MDIKIRGIDPLIVKKLDEEAMQHDLSRNAYLIEIVTNFISLSGQTELIERYESLSKNVITSIAELTNIIIDGKE